MARTDSTCWTVIEGAAKGDVADRVSFAGRYTAVLRAYLSARWRRSCYQQELDDAVQEVFLECFRTGGVLDRVDAQRPGGFRAFLYGVARHVALRIEGRGARQRHAALAEGSDVDELAADEASLSQVFDRAWSSALLREAAHLQAETARLGGAEPVRRVELLRLRFQENLPIREIARRWGLEPALVHREYAKARQEFKTALLQVLVFHHPGSAGELEQQCADLLAVVG